MLKIRNSEWRVLFSQLVNSGMDKWGAKDIIEKHKLIMEEYCDKLKASKKPKEDIEVKFKEKFYQLCQGLER